MGVVEYGQSLTLPSMPCMTNRQSRRSAVSGTESAGASLCGRGAGADGKAIAEGRLTSRRCVEVGAAESVNEMYLQRVRLERDGKAVSRTKMMKHREKRTGWPEHTTLEGDG